MATVFILIFMICFLSIPSSNLSAQGISGIGPPETVLSLPSQEANPVFIGTIKIKKQQPQQREEDKDNRKLDLGDLHVKPTCAYTFRVVYNQPKAREEALVREQWSQALGIDVWAPYYAYKDAEKWIKHRVQVKLWSLKGEPEFDRKQVFYTFKAKF